MLTATVQKYRFVRGKNKGNHVQKTLSRQPQGSNNGGWLVLLVVIIAFLSFWVEYA